MKNKIKNWIIGILFAIVCGLGISFASADKANANSTYVNNKTVTYEVVTIPGRGSVGIFIYGNDMEVVKL